MPKGRKKKNKVAAKPPAKPDVPYRDGGDAQQFHNRQIAFNHHEVERRIAAIRAIQEAEVQNILARLRMLRSYFSKEQLQTPALKFFQENLPNLSVVRNEEDRVFELRQNNEKFLCGKGRASVVSTVAGQQFSVESVKHSFLNAAGLQIPDFDLDGALDTQMSQMLGVGNALQTPGGMSNRSSFGTTPASRTSRPPLQGEMLLSVRGSPLGIYKEDHLEAIHESGDGSHGDFTG